MLCNVLQKAEGNTQQQGKVQNTSHNYNHGPLRKQELHHTIACTQIYDEKE